MSELQQPVILPKLPAPGISVRRIRFVPQLPSGARSAREFHEPRTSFAVEEKLELAQLPCDRPWPESTDTLLVLHLPHDAAAPWLRFAEDWLQPGRHADAVLPAEIQGRGRRVLWRPGRAVIIGNRPDQTGMPEDVLAALVDFSFYEAELRNLELAVKIGENRMSDDVSKAYRIRYRDRQAWPRFTEMIQYFARLIIVQSMLEPRLKRASRSLPRLSRRWFLRLIEEADALERLEQLETRLEIGEAIYEGANDRVSDYKGYHFGHVLEVLIILFLIAEVVLMVREIQELERANKETDAEASAIVVRLDRNV